MTFGPPSAKLAEPIRHGAVAQLVAHLHGMEGVRGSSPLSSTHFRTSALWQGDSIPRQSPTRQVVFGGAYRLERAPWPGANLQVSGLRLLGTET